MALTTGGTPYVTSTDLVANYPTSSLALANRTDVVASGGPVLVKTAGYTITIADILGGNKFLYNSASPGTFTLPTSSLVDGMVVEASQIGAGALTLSGGTIVGTTATTAQYQGLTFVYVASGTTWYSIAPSATAPGLAGVTPSSIANSGGSASASGATTTFTGVTSLSLNGVFTSTYTNYRIVLNSVASTGTLINMRMRAAGTDATGGNYLWNINYISPAGGAYTSYGNGNNVTLASIASVVGTSTAPASLDVFYPQLARPTSVQGGGTFGDSNGVSNYFVHNLSTAYDGFTIYPASGNMTGTISVYGYKI